MATSATINNNANSTHKQCECAGIDMVVYSAIVAIILAKDLTPAQINLLAGFIQSVGQNLYTITAAKQYCQTMHPNFISKEKNC